jgi:tetratricopeptide (TPR) repeat protein
MHRQLRAFGFCAVLLLATIVPHVVHAYSFEPTDFEWASWPEYCHARYVTTEIGGGTKWARTYSQSLVLSEKRRIGEPSFLHVHHYCAGLAWFSRYKTEAQKNLKDSYLGQANTEMAYTYERIPESSPIYASVAVNMARVTAAMGQTEEAVKIVEHAVSAHPDDPRPYIGLSVLYRDLKKLDQARDALLRGDTATGGNSAEIHYTLGLIYFELNDFDHSVEYAQKAYAKNYPLPGLQDKLRRAGHWPG